MDHRLDYDLDECLNYCTVFFDSGLQLNSTMIEEVVAVVEGERDREPWWWVVKLHPIVEEHLKIAGLKSGRFALLTGGCDFTGWDCRAYSSVLNVDTTARKAVLSTECLDALARAALLKQIAENKRTTTTREGVLARLRGVARPVATPAEDGERGRD